MRDNPSITTVKAEAFTVPFDVPEADDTPSWDRSKIVLVQVTAGGERGLDHSYTAAAALCEAAHRDLSGHCAPALHLPVAVSAPRFRHLEWFHDHVRNERMVFDGAPEPRGGFIAPDISRPGHGLILKMQDVQAYAV